MATIQPLLKPFHPIIDWGNPITQGLVFDAPFFEGSGSIAEDDVLGDLGLEGIITASGATWDKGFYGTDLDFSAAASKVSYTTPASVNSLPLLSVEILCYIRSAGGGGLGRIIHKKNNTAEYWGFQMQSTNQLAFMAGWSTANAAALFTTTLGNWYHILVTYSFSSTANVPILYINGVNVGGGSGATGTALTDDANLYIGNRADGIRNFDGKISYARVWNRILTPTEARSLYTNPWQIYVKPNYNPFYVPSPTIITPSAFVGWKTLLGVGQI